MTSTIFSINQHLSQVPQNVYPIFEVKLIKQSDACVIQLLYRFLNINDNKSTLALCMEVSWFKFQCRCIKRALYTSILAEVPSLNILLGTILHLLTGEKRTSNKNHKIQFEWAKIMLVMRCK